MIESGTHLWNCMTYIDLNMVRAGVVKHPRAWKWGGYDELVGTRTRHTVLRMDKMLELVGAGSREEFVRGYAATLEELIGRGGLRREPHWTESIAVGSREYVAAIDDQIKGRMRTKPSETQDGAWSVREPEAPYGQISGTKIERKRGAWVLRWV